MEDGYHVEQRNKLMKENTEKLYKEHEHILDKAARYYSKENLISPLRTQEDVKSIMKEVFMGVVKMFTYGIKKEVNGKNFEDTLKFYVLEKVRCLRSELRVNIPWPKKRQ